MTRATIRTSQVWKPLHVPATRSPKSFTATSIGARW